MSTYVKIEYWSRIKLRVSSLFRRQWCTVFFYRVLYSCGKIIYTSVHGWKNVDSVYIGGRANAPKYVCRQKCDEKLCTRRDFPFLRDVIFHGISRVDLTTFQYISLHRWDETIFQFHVPRVCVGFVADINICRNNLVNLMFRDSQ